MTLYRTLFAWDVLFVLVLSCFFADGLRYNAPGGMLAVWLPVLAVPIAMLVAASALHNAGKNRLAMTLVLLLAVPPALFVLFYGVLILTNPRWN